MNFNKAIILGRVVRDPETRSLPTGNAVASFSVATNRVWTNKDTKEKQEQVEFHNIVAFGRLGEICGQYLNKGSLVCIEGRIQTRSWQGQDGVKKYRTEIIAENMQMGPRSSSGNASTGNAAPKNSASQMPQREEIPVIDQEEMPQIEEDKEEVNVKDIPF